MSFGFKAAGEEVEHYKILLPERNNKLNMVMLTLVISEDGSQRELYWLFSPVPSYTGFKCWQRFESQKCWNCQLGLEICTDGQICQITYFTATAQIPWFGLEGSLVVKVTRVPVSSGDSVP